MIVILTPALARRTGITKVDRHPQRSNEVRSSNVFDARQLNPRDGASSQSIFSTWKPTTREKRRRLKKRWKRILTYIVHERSHRAATTVVTLHRVWVSRVARLEVVQPLERSLLRKHPPQNPLINPQRVFRLGDETRRGVESHLYELRLWV